MYMFVHFFFHRWNELNWDVLEGNNSLNNIFLTVSYYFKNFMLQNMIFCFKKMYICFQYDILISVLTYY